MPIDLRVHFIFGRTPIAGDAAAMTSRKALIRAEIVSCLLAQTTHASGLPVLPLLELVTDYATPRAEVSTYVARERVDASDAEDADSGDGGGDEKRKAGSTASRKARDARKDCAEATEPFISDENMFAPRHCLLWTDKALGNRYLLYTAAYAVYAIDLRTRKTAHAFVSHRIVRLTLSCLCPTDAVSPFASKANSPQFLCVNPKDNSVYVTDAHRVRRVAFGDISVVAGSLNSGRRSGVGAAAMFRDPRGLALSSDGRFAYVCDRGNSLVRKIVLKSGLVTLPQHRGFVTYPCALAMAPPAPASTVDEKPYPPVAPDSALIASADQFTTTLYRLQLPELRETLINLTRRLHISGLTFLTPHVVVVTCLYSHSLFAIDTRTGATEPFAGAALSEPPPPATNKNKAAATATTALADAKVVRPNGYVDGGVDRARFNAPTGVYAAVHDGETEPYFLVCDAGNAAIRQVMLPGDWSADAITINTASTSPVKK